MFPLFPLQKFVITGHSMEPALKEGKVVLVSYIPYLFRTPQLDDVVAVSHPHTKKSLIKRITKITSAGYFVEGDNKHHSTDSRSFGEITRKQIIGKVVAVL